MGIKKPSFRFSIYEDKKWYLAEDVDEILTNGVEVKGDLSNEWRPVDSSTYGAPSYTGLLINIQPIKKETAEDLVREIHDNQLALLSEDFRARCRAVLDD